jgi:S-adenosylmethionine decarboxylase
MLMTHILAELYSCNHLIQDPAALAEIAKGAARSVGATIAGEAAVSYAPHGLTIAIFLAESHIVLSTWPEHRLVLVDILLCNPAMDHTAVLSQIREQVCPEGQIVVHPVPRKIAERP